MLYNMYLPHLDFLLIQTHIGVKLCDGSRVAMSIAIHVRTTGVAVQMLPAAVTLPVSTSRGHSGGKKEFAVLSMMGREISHL